VNRFESIKLAAISLIIFVAWLIAAAGWLRLVGILWLIYPAVVAMRVVGHRRLG
jgi:hypothetical protein